MDIKLNNITKKFKGKTVLADFSLTLPENTISVIMGETGTRKDNNIEFNIWINKAR